jgi:hypothetical protein
MTMLFVADLHYALKQFDWLVANATSFDPIIIGGDLLDLGSALDFDVQIMVVEKYLGRIRQQARLLSARAITMAIAVAPRTNRWRNGFASARRMVFSSMATVWSCQVRW